MKLSEEEKEVIENIDLLVHCLKYGEMKMTIASKRQKEIAQELQMLLNLLDKKQKEIEKLKFNNHMVGKWNEYLDKDCISKNRIKEIIKKYIDIEEALNYTNQEIYGEDLKNMILELLGEN